MHHQISLTLCIDACPPHALRTGSEISPAGCARHCVAAPMRMQDLIMNRNELRKADINLMVVLEALMLERNVTRVAEKLFLGQPTISAALNRLRTAFNDPLFIRIGHRMEPNARAEKIIH